jgi:DegV family protein with EDD domain
MGNIAIVTDSTADLAEEQYKKNNITVVPLSVIFGEDVYTDDGVALSREEFYQKLKAAKSLPTTAQPTPEDFKKVYEKLLENNQSIISIHISRKMSGTMDSAETAKKALPAGDIEVIDSEMTTMALGLLVLKAAEMAAEGKSKEALLDTIQDIKSKTTTLFIPHSLEYLQKGGRIGRAKGLIASLLEIKPLLTLSEGEVSQFKNTRRWNQAKTEMLETMQGKVRNGEKLMIAVADADLQDEGDAFADRVKETFNPKFIMRTSIGCVVGTHLGPAIAVAFYEE